MSPVMTGSRLVAGAGSTEGGKEEETGEVDKPGATLAADVADAGVGRDT